MGIFSNSRTNSSDSIDKSPSVTDVDSMSVKHAEPGTGGQFKEFIKQVISFTGDLSSLTCPAFFLNGLSLLEYGYVYLSFSYSILLPSAFFFGYSILFLFA